MSFRYSNEEHEIMCAAFSDGLNDQQIVESINNLRCNRERGVKRTVPSVHSRRRSLGLLRKERKETRVPDYRCCDLLFQDAMKQAIYLGIEHVREGVFHDTTPFVGRMIHPEPLFSGCSSSAGLCADVGDEHAAAWEAA